MANTNTTNGFFQTTGRLIEKGDIRFVGGDGGWRVQSFVLAYRTGTREQEVLMEAVKSAVDTLAITKTGAMITCSGTVKGRKRAEARDGDHLGRKYYNIIEIETVEI